MLPAALLRELEQSARCLIEDHARDAFEAALAGFVAAAKVIVAGNAARGLGAVVCSAKAAAMSERAAANELHAALLRETDARRAADAAYASAAEQCERWRRKASEQAQAAGELSEARTLAHEAAVFWKARCICATAAIKHMTGEDFAFMPASVASGKPPSRR